MTQKTILLVIIAISLCTTAFSQQSAQVIGSTMTADKWREDLRHMAAEIERMHKNPFHKTSREEFYKAVTELDRRIPSLGEDEVIAGLMRIVTLVGDGHTGLRWGKFDEDMVLPVSFHQFEDGIYVRRAVRGHENILGAKLVRVGGKPVAEVIDALRPIIWRDNEMGVKGMAPILLSVPKILHGTGLSNSPSSANFVFEKDGRELSVELKSSVKLGELRTENPNWVDARRSDVAVPLWQKDPANNFRFEVIPSTKTMYVQYNAVQNKPDETIESFFNRMFREAEKQPVERIVLDMRLNGGGNNTLNKPITIGAIRSRFNEPGKFFVIIGRETFSAAQNAVNDLEKYTNAIFVGEPTGASPNHFGDARPIELPNSKITLQASTLWWQDKDPRDRRVWKAPDIAADMTFEHYRNGRDPAMEAILAYTPAQSLDQIVADLRSDRDVAAFVKKVREFKANPAHRYADVEARLNQVGYFLLNAKSLDEAITVFKLNTELYPSSANTYDSLGEAHLAKGNKALALENYEKAMKLDPSMASAIEAVRRLKETK